MAHSRQPGGACRLLLVEHDARVMDELRRLFGGPTFDCELARSVRTAEQILADRRMDVIAVDAALDGLPRGGTPALIQQLKARGPGMKVVIFNGMTAKAGQRRMRRLGADGYLSKKNSLQALLRSVQRLVGGDA